VSSTRFVPIPEGEYFPGDIVWIKSRISDEATAACGDVFLVAEVRTEHNSVVECTLVGGERTMLLIKKGCLFHYQSNPHRFREYGIGATGLLARGGP
jgi:hypothetical protein